MRSTGMRSTGKLHLNPPGSTALRGPERSSAHHRGAQLLFTSKTIIQEMTIQRRKVLSTGEARGNEPLLQQRGVLWNVVLRSCFHPWQPAVVFRPSADPWLSSPNLKALISMGWQRCTEEPELLLLANFPKGFTQRGSCGRRRSPLAAHVSSVHN